VSEEMALPPKVQQRLMRYQQLQQTLQAIAARKQQLRLELMEVENALKALSEADDATPVYKSVGALLIRAEKAKLIQELEDKKSVIELHLERLETQEKRAQEELKDIEAKLRRDLGGGPVPDGGSGDRLTRADG